MADTKTTEQRHDAALESIAKALGTTAAELTGEAKGDPHWRTITMENIAAAFSRKYKKRHRAAASADKAGSPGRR
jgi:hypothetical protein